MIPFYHEYKVQEKDVSRPVKKQRFGDCGPQRYIVLNENEGAHSTYGKTVGCVVTSDETELGSTDGRLEGVKGHKLR